MHDWWAYLVVTVTGGTVVFDSSPASLYRQHQRNVIGSKKSLFACIFDALRRGAHHFLALMSANAHALSLHPALTPAAQNLLHEFENMNDYSFLTRFRPIRHIRTNR